MPKFFVTPEALEGNCITLQEENFNHAKNVLRLTVNDEILINDRQGNDYKCIIQAIKTDHILAEIKEKCTLSTEPATKTVLFQSLIKGEKMEWVIQKAVEIGVTSIIPLITDRCVVKLESDKKTEAKVQRWQKIAESAAKQSGRAIIPEVCQPMTFKLAVAYAKDHIEKSLIPYEKEKKQGLKSFFKTLPPKEMGIFIGPEGGFTEEEILYAASQGVVPVTLGNRILRSETAGLVTLSATMYEMDEMM